MDIEKIQVIIKKNDEEKTIKNCGYYGMYQRDYIDILTFEEVYFET